MEIFSPDCLNKTYKLLIFDLDGTLADTIESIREGVNLAMNKYGFPERSYDEIRSFIGRGARDLIRRSLPSDAEISEELYERVFADYHAFYGHTFAHCDHCYDGIIETLCALKEKGYTIAVLSNKQDVYVKALVDNLLPEGTVSLAMGQTDLPKKPDPTVPLMITEQLGFTSDETAFIGDSEVDMQTGNNAHMFAVGCSWGYSDRDRLIENGAHCVLDEPTGLVVLFEGKENAR